MRTRATSGWYSTLKLNPSWNVVNKILAIQPCIILAYVEQRSHFGLSDTSNVNKRLPVYQSAKRCLQGNVRKKGPILHASSRRPQWIPASTQWSASVRCSVPTVMSCRVCFVNIRQIEVLFFLLLPCWRLSHPSRFRGSKLSPITLTQDYVQIMVENLPSIWQVLCDNESYICKNKDVTFRMNKTVGYCVARLYGGKKFIHLKPGEISYLLKWII
jgi:hypothetical protein